MPTLREEGARNLLMQIIEVVESEITECDDRMLDIRVRAEQVQQQAGHTE